MPEEKKPPCKIFSEQQISELKGAGKLKITSTITLTLLCVFIALLFIPFTTVMSIAEKTAVIATILAEREKRNERYQERIEKRLLKIEKVQKSFQINLNKRLWWIDKNSRETNDKLKDIAFGISEDSPVKKKYKD